jgi:hypothetical protein
LCALHDAAGDRGRRAIVQAMAEALHKTGSAVLQDTYAQKTALRLGVATEAMRLEFKKVARAPAAEPEEAAAPTEPGPRPTQHEWWLLRVLLEGNDQIDWVAAHLDTAWLPSPDTRQIVAQRLQLGHDWPGAAAWLSQPENTRWQNLVSEILADSRPIPDAVTLLQGSLTRDGIVKTLRDKDIERRLAEVNRRLAASETSEDAQSQLLAEMQQLRQLKKQPLSARSDQ